MKKWPKSSLLFSRHEWYGMLYSQADSKKKSNLMMSLFEPGPEPLPWLGKITHLGPISGNTPDTSKKQTTIFTSKQTGSL